MERFFFSLVVWRSAAGFIDPVYVWSVRIVGLYDPVYRSTDTDPGSQPSGYLSDYVIPACGGAALGHRLHVSVFTEAQSWHCPISTAQPLLALEASVATCQPEPIIPLFSGVVIVMAKWLYIQPMTTYPLLLRLLSVNKNE